MLVLMENEENQKEIQEDQESKKIYELGYLIVSSVPEDGLLSEVVVIKDLINENNGVFISEEFPKLKSLAYKIFNKIESKKYAFETAYFGWIKFEAKTSSVASIKEKLDKNPSLLRFIIIKTVRENTVGPNHVHILKKPEHKRIDGSEGLPDVTDEKDVVSEKEIDESIEKLVV